MNGVSELLLAEIRILGNRRDLLDQPEFQRFPATGASWELSALMDVNLAPGDVLAVFYPVNSGNRSGLTGAMGLSGWKLPNLRRFLNFLTTHCWGPPLCHSGQDYLGE
jgi:hypothetical protein